MEHTTMTKVFILYTGGTIGMVKADDSNPVSPLVPATKEDLRPFISGLEKIGIQWEIGGLIDDNGQTVPPLDSSDVNHKHWIYMAKAIAEVYEQYDGFVVLHGTDTMAYTASALSFLLANLAKPVVVTGSQLPIFEARTDAVQNLVNSLYIAGYKATDLPLIPEVTICFADSVLRGNRTTKVSSTQMQGFGSPNYPKLATIGEHINVDMRFVRPPATDKFYVNTSLVTDVMDLVLFPGFKAEQLEALLGLPKVKGIVLRTFGAGNAPGYKDFLEAIRIGIEQKHKVILNVTQCVQGTVEMGLYAASSGLLERGVISGLDMTAEAALTKMMWTLATTAPDDLEEVQTQLQISWRGEQSENLFDLRYTKGLGRESDPHEMIVSSASASSKFRKALLNRAVLRISDIGFENWGADESVELRVFVNLPSADNTTSLNDPHYAGTFTCLSGESASLLMDVTETVKVVTEDGRPVYINLLPVGKKVWCKGIYLALFAKAE